MKNKEKYFDQIIQATIKHSYCAFVKKHMKDYDFKLKEYKEFGNKKLCSGKECEKCKEHFITWLEQEYIEEPKLSHDEYVILKNVNDIYYWITRDRNGDLYLHSHKPSKEKYYWDYKGLSISIDEYLPFTNIFLFIKWEDEEPYEIKALLDEYEKFYGGKQHEICRF